MTRSKTLMVLGLAMGLMPLADRATAAGPFDGVYAGIQRETRTNNSGQCQNINRDNIRITITNSTITYHWGPIPLVATIGGDGSFSVDQVGQAATRGASASLSLKGRITGGNLEADVGGSACAAHISLKKA